MRFNEQSASLFETARAQLASNRSDFETGEQIRQEETESQIGIPRVVGYENGRARVQIQGGGELLTDLITNASISGPPELLVSNNISRLTAIDRPPAVPDEEPPVIRLLGFIAVLYRVVNVETEKLEFWLGGFRSAPVKVAEYPLFADLREVSESFSGLINTDSESISIDSGIMGAIYFPEDGVIGAEVFADAPEGIQPCQLPLKVPPEERFRVAAETTTTSYRHKENVSGFELLPSTSDRAFVGSIWEVGEDYEVSGTQQGFGRSGWRVGGNGPVTLQQIPGGTEEKLGFYYDGELLLSILTASTHRVDLLGFTFVNESGNLEVFIQFRQVVSTTRSYSYYIEQEPNSGPPGSGPRTSVCGDPDLAGDAPTSRTMQVTASLDDSDGSIHSVTATATATATQGNDNQQISEPVEFSESQYTFTGDNITAASTKTLRAGNVGYGMTFNVQTSGGGTANASTQFKYRLIHYTEAFVSVEGRIAFVTVKHSRNKSEDQSFTQIDYYMVDLLSGAVSPLDAPSPLDWLAFLAADAYERNINAPDAVTQFYRDQTKLGQTAYDRIPQTSDAWSVSAGTGVESLGGLPLTSFLEQPGISGQVSINLVSYVDASPIFRESQQSTVYSVGVPYSDIDGIGISAR